MSKERRQHPRFEGRFPVEVLNTGDDPERSVWESIISGEALDVSRTGMRLQTPYHVPVGSAVSVLVYHKGLSSLCMGNVVWRREAPEGGFLYGLYVDSWTTISRPLSILFAATNAADAPAQADLAATSALPVY
jgi:hypothetical protein